MWTDKDTGAFAFTDNKATCVAPQGGSTIHTAMYVGDNDSAKVTAGTARYFEFLIGQTDTNLTLSGLAVGVTDKAHLEDGWKVRAALYNGNLSDGGAMLVADFGPFLKPGDRAGIAVDMRTADTMKLYFTHNGRPLGQGFNMTQFPKDGVFPVFACGGPGATAAVTESDVPSTDRILQQFEGLNGYFRVDLSSYRRNGTTASFASPSEAEMAEVTPITMKLTDTGKVVSMQGKIMNNVTVTFTRDGDHFKGVAGPSTMMGGPEEIMKLENGMLKFFSDTTNVALQDKTLRITSTDAEIMMPRVDEPTPAVATTVRDW